MAIPGSAWTATNDEDKSMDGIAAIAIHQAAAASALGVGSLPAIPLDVAEAFAAGALLSGLCMLPVIAPRRAHQRNARPAARRPRDASPSPRSRPPARSRPDGVRRRERQGPPDRSAQAAKPAAARRRTGGRHAAPSAGGGVRMPGRRASRLAVRD